MDTAERMAEAKTAKTNMRRATVAYKDHSKKYSEYECEYRILLSKKVLKLKADDVSTTIINNIAYGDKEVAREKCKMNIEHGLMKSSENAIINYRLEFKTLSDELKLDFQYHE